MRPRARAIFLVAAIVLVVAGLLVSGPAHFGLHGAGDSHGCDACAVHGASPAPASPSLGPPQLACLASDPPPSAMPSASPRLLPPARGPPRTG